MNQTFDGMMKAMGFNKQYTTKSPDSNVESVRQILLERSNVGLAKYGTTTERDDLTRKQWLRHAQEESLDFAVYLEKLIQMEDE